MPVRSEEIVISCCLELLDVLWVEMGGNDRGRQLFPNWDDSVGERLGSHCSGNWQEQHSVSDGDARWTVVQPGG